MICILSSWKEDYEINISGLFHKAIAESGVVSNYWSFNEWTSKAENSGYQIVEKLGKKTRDPKVAYDFLKTIDAKQLIQFVQIEDEQSNLVRTSILCNEKRMQLVYACHCMCKNNFIALTSCFSLIGKLNLSLQSV